MKLIQIAMLSILTSCGAFGPDIAKITDDLTDTGVNVDVAKEAFNEDSDITINVSIISKDPVVQPLAPVVHIVQPAPAPLATK